jgi:Ser/Thr protein kinase RdoA (MazF antagonist)
MVTSAILGEPIAMSNQRVVLGPVLREAGRDLALINGIEVDGFGWIRRDRPESTRLHAELPTLHAFVLDDLERQLLELGGLVSYAEIEHLRTVVVGNNELFDSTRAFLAHGDFDASHIYHVDGVYSGIIDFGEIRGTDRWYDLGHFALHDGEHVPLKLLPLLLAGYGEVTALPPDHMARIRFWALLVGVRTLARIADRPRTAYHDFLAGSVTQLLSQSDGRAL